MFNPRIEIAVILKIDDQAASFYECEVLNSIANIHERGEVAVRDVVRRITIQQLGHLSRLYRINRKIADYPIPIVFFGAFQVRRYSGQAKLKERCSLPLAGAVCCFSPNGPTHR
jgi:hypothetical protein